MKCRLDGPSPSDVAQHKCGVAGVQVIPTPFCWKVQKEYAAMFASVKQKGCKTSELPRRVLPRPQDDKPTMANLKRKRAEQMTELCDQQPTTSSSDPDTYAELRDLQETVVKHARKRATAEQESFAKRLTKYAAKQQQKVLQDGLVANPDAARQLRDHMTAAEQSKLRSLETRSLALALEQPPLSFGTLIIATTSKHQDEFNALGADFRVWPRHGPDCSKLCGEVLRSSLKAVWLCSSEEKEMGMISHPGNATTFTASAVLVGGYVAGPGWCELCLKTGKLVPGIVSLSCALSVPRQVHFHESLNAEAAAPSAAAKALSIAVSAAKPDLGGFAWNILAKWKDMRLGLNDGGPSTHT